MSELQFDKFMEVVVECTSAYSAATGIFFFFAGMFFCELLETFLDYVIRGVACVFEKVKKYRLDKDG